MFTGEMIKVFPDTDIQAYTRMIHEAGFHSSLEGEYLIVGNPLVMASEEQRRALGRKITAQMKEKGYSREQLANELGVKLYTVWDWQLGRNSPNEYNREKLRKVGFEI